MALPLSSLLPTASLRTKSQPITPNRIPNSLILSQTQSPFSQNSHQEKMALQLWETLKESITVYTGHSPATCFTILAVALALYYVISGLFGSASSPAHHRRSFEERMEPLPPPVQVGEISEEDLKVYDGSDSSKPLHMAIKGQIYDVSQSRMFYGPDGPYALFSGKDASRALAKMSFEEQDLTGDISGLGPFELDTLQDWEYKFMSKYVKVGTIKKPDEPSPSGPAPAPETAEEGVASDKPVEEEELKEAAVAADVEMKKDD